MNRQARVIAKAARAGFPQGNRAAAVMGLLLLGGVLALAPLARGQTVLPPPAPDAQADARQDQIEQLQRQLTQATADNETLQRQLRDARAEIARLQGVVSDLTAANANAVQG